MNLHLGTNNLLSPISSKMGKLKNLVSLDLSSNMLTGPLFHTLTNLRSLVKLYLGGNFFNGTIATEICNIKSLMTLHLGENNLFGSPHINIGSTSTKNVTKWTKIIFPTVISFIFLLLAIVLLSCQKIIGNTRSECKAKRNGDIFWIWNYDGSIAFEDIITAKEDFNIKYCIGTGDYGNVYKAMLPSGKVIALKKLHRLES